MQQTVGDVLRTWRQRRHYSQLGLATDAGVSARHLSFVETGRAKPSRDMLLRLADQLDLPLRERNGLLLAGGFAPLYSQSALGDPSMRHVREAVDLILKGHEPFPALAVDRGWNLLAMNRATGLLLTGVAASLLEPPVNVLRVCFHPEGMAPNVRNPEVLFPMMLGRLQHEIDVTADEGLIALRDELQAYPVMRGLMARRADRQDLVVPFVVETEAGVMRFMGTTTVFGTASDVTVAELTIESFFPADEATGTIVRSAMARA